MQVNFKPNFLHPEFLNGQLGEIRNNWHIDEVEALFAMPFADLIFAAQYTHRQNFDPNQVQFSKLLNIKTGSCPEDCKYCPQSAHYNTNLAKEPLMKAKDVAIQAAKAREEGASRFCMGAAWRNLNDRDLPVIIDMIKEVKALGLETCMTLGMLNEEQAIKLKEAGLDFYNHNIDTSEEYYEQIITTRTYKDRLDTLQTVRNSGMKVCCGGIMGMGETIQDRANMLVTLATMTVHPESVPINMLVKIDGTPLDSIDDLDILEFVKTIAVARIMMPKSYVRLSAGRNSMSDEAQALCFLAGANSIFCGDKLLTTPNPGQDRDSALFSRLGISASH